MTLCLAKDRFNKPCRCVKIVVDGNPIDFCKFHQYMNEGYTTEMLENLELCKGCNKMYYFGDQELKTCEKCQKRCEINREKKKKQIILCNKNGCKFKRSQINEYCLKHQICLFENEVLNEGKKLCTNYIRGCRSKLEMDYGFTRCQDCLQKNRDNDHIKRKGAVAANPTKENHKICTVCCKEYPLENFKGAVVEMTKTCNNCREQNIIQNNKRDREHVNALSRINDKKPERIAVKNEWKEKNYEKVASYWMKSRQTLIEAGIEQYLQKNAENAKRWRENNPEKVLQINEDKKQSPELQYGVYQRTAQLKNLDFELSFEEYREIVHKSCYYCGEFSENKTINGIDRKDQTKGYIMVNCVPCCRMCNMMKNTLNEDKFLQKIEHILLYNKMILNGDLYPDSFRNHNNKSISFISYKRRADKKKIDFNITENDFITITNNPCYLCGKQPNENHKNGIDRFDSKIGYIIDNCRSCCGDCNYLKRIFNYNDMIRKFALINKNIKRLYCFEKHPENKFLEKSNKKSKEEMKKFEAERKKIQRDKLRKNMVMKNIKKCMLKKLQKIEKIKN